MCWLGLCTHCCWGKGTKYYMCIMCIYSLFMYEHPVFWKQIINSQTLLRLMSGQIPNGWPWNGLTFVVICNHNRTFCHLIYFTGWIDTQKVCHVFVMVTKHIFLCNLAHHLMLLDPWFVGHLKQKVVCPRSIKYQSFGTVCKITWSNQGWISNQWSINGEENFSLK